MVKMTMDAQEIALMQEIKESPDSKVALAYRLGRKLMALEFQEAINSQTTVR